MKSHLVHSPDMEVFAVASLYQDGTSALILVDKDEQKVVTASANLSDEITIPWDQLLIKDYTENEGTLKTLTLNDIVDVSKKTYFNGSVGFPIVTIIDKSVLRELKKLRKQYKIDTGAMT